MIKNRNISTPPEVGNESLEQVKALEDVGVLVLALCWLAVRVRDGGGVGHHIVGRQEGAACRRNSFGWEDFFYRHFLQHQRSEGRPERPTVEHLRSQIQIKDHDVATPALL